MSDQPRSTKEVLQSLTEKDYRLVALQATVAQQAQMIESIKAENGALLTALKGMTSMYGYCWDLVDGGLLCMHSNVQRFEDAHEAAQKVIATMSKEG
jgi:hypothetical protein